MAWLAAGRYGNAVPFPPSFPADDLRMSRHSTGLPALDELLGGGLKPGTLTVVLGATGIGKTQLGLQYANAGAAQEQERGILFDLTSRGDTQNHEEYAQRMCGWTMRQRPPEVLLDPLSKIWDREFSRWDIARLFQRAGRRVSVKDMDFDQQREWKADLNRKLQEAIAFFYGNFCLGVRRCVIDGIEPTDRPSESFQFDLFEYISHQILRKEHDWVARDLLRVHFRELQEQVQQHAYDVNAISAMMLCTSHEVLLDDLLARRIETGDVLSNANTIILMGKLREGTTMKRALHIAKHRGSACDDGIHEFEITSEGVALKRVVC